MNQTYGCRLPGCRLPGCRLQKLVRKDISGLGANVPVYGGGFSYAYRLEHLSLNRSRAAPCHGPRNHRVGFGVLCWQMVRDGCEVETVTFRHFASILDYKLRTSKSHGAHDQGDQCSGVKTSASLAFFGKCML